MIAQLSGHDVVAATRRPSGTYAEWVFYDLKAPSFELPNGVGAVVHLAVDVVGHQHGSAREVSAAQALIAESRRTGAKLVFVSSQAARPNASTDYGRTKWRIEQEVLAANGWVIRPGQVYGGVEQGLFGMLARLVRRLPVLPAFVPHPFVQPIHVDDCALGLLRFVERNDIPSGVYSLASSEPVSFQDFLSAMSRAWVRRPRLFVPVPVFLIRVLVRLLGATVSERLGLQRLISLFELPRMETMTDLQRIGLELRPLSSGMCRSGFDRRRRLIREGMTLLAYLLKERAGSVLVRRYVRLVEDLRQGEPLSVPSWIHGFPAGWVLLDGQRRFGIFDDGEFSWRLNAATTVAEASPQGARRFLGESKRIAKPIAVMLMLRAGGAELMWRAVRLIFRPLLVLAMRRGVR
jgi:uncharacterized protein YbjT (DUF2867 family)